MRGIQEGQKCRQRPAAAESPISAKGWYSGRWTHPSPVGLDRVIKRIKLCSRQVPSVQSYTDGYIVPLTCKAVRRGNVVLCVDVSRMGGRMTEDETIDGVGQGIGEGRFARPWDPSFWSSV